MRNLTHLNVPKDTSSQFPFHQIQNETATQEGTPVYRELYGDIVQNIWKIVGLSGIPFTGNEDSEDSQFQLVDALRKFTNELNDIEQTLTLTANVWSVPFNLDLLPNRYFFIANASADWDSTINYQFKGSGNELKGISSTGFKSSDEVLVILDDAGVRIYNLNGLITDSLSSLNVSSIPLAFNDSDVFYYFDNGRLFTDGKDIYNINDSIIDAEQNNNLTICECVVLKSKLICLVFDSSNQSYRVFSFSTNDFNTPTECIYSGFSPETGVDNSVYMYCDGESIFFTNEFNSSANDFNLSKALYSETSNTLTFSASIPLNANVFIKTTNAVINNNVLFHFVGSDLKSHNLSTLTASIIFDNYTLNVGNLFNYKSEIFFYRNGISSKWTL